MKGFNTKAIIAGQSPDKLTGAVIPPVYLASTYDQSVVDELKYFYSRGENPTRFALEDTMAAVEDAKHSLVFSSGQAAGLALINLLKPGDHIASVNDVYGGTYNLFKLVEASSGIITDLFEMTTLDNLEEELHPATKMFWIETPTNPMLKVIDIEKICAIARKKGIKVIIDNTFCTAYLQRPLDLGADYVLYSTTKYYSGHLDAIGGAIVLNDDDDFGRLKSIQTTGGAVPSPFDCMLISRGLKTLGIRMDRHVKNAFEICDYLKSHSLVERVIYPGLKEHPQYDIVCKQMKQPGGMISFYYKGDPEKLMKELKIFSCAVSLGGVRSLIECPALMTHRPIPKETKEKLGITNSLMRLSVGIEDSFDLIEDLGNAMK